MNKNIIIKYLFHWIVLSIFIPCITAGGLFPKLLGENTILIWIIIFYASARLSSLLVIAANRVVEANFWVFVYVFFGVATLFQTSEGHFPWYGIYSQDTIYIAQFIILLGCFSFDIGIRGRIQINVNSNIVNIIPSNFYDLKFYKLLIVLLLGTILSVVSITKLGGFDIFILPRRIFHKVLEEKFNLAELNILIAFARTIPYTLLIILIYYVLRTHKKRITMILIIVALAPLVFFVNNPISTARFQIGTILLAIYYVFPWNRRKMFVSIYGLIFLMTIVFPYADIFRGTINVNLGQRIETYEEYNPLINKPDYDAFQQVMNGVKARESIGLQWGHQVLSAFLFWVPRSVWSEKGLSTGQLIAQTDGYSFTNVSSPLWIEYYLDGGFSLVIIGFFIYGRLVCFLDNSRRNRKSSSSIFVFSTIFAGYEIYLLRGSLMPAIAYISPVIAILLLIYFISHIRLTIYRSKYGFYSN